MCKLHVYFLSWLRSKIFKKGEDVRREEEEGRGGGGGEWRLLNPKEMM